MSDDLRARVEAAADDFDARVGHVANGQNPYRALLADPAPEAAREASSPQTYVVGGRECGRCRRDGLTCHPEGGLICCAGGCDRCDSAVESRARALEEAGLGPADLPVATGVTTEDEGCSAGHLEHGACACPAPAPVVSAGDEGALVELLTRQAREGDEAVAEVARLRRRVRCLERDNQLLAARVAEAGARAEGRVEWGHAHADDMVTVAARSEADARATVDGWNERWNSDGKGVLMSRVVGEWEPTQ